MGLVVKSIWFWIKDDWLIWFQNDVVTTFIVTKILQMWWSLEKKKEESSIICEKKKKSTEKTFCNINKRLYGTFKSFVWLII